MRYADERRRFIQSKRIHTEITKTQAIFIAVRVVVCTQVLVVVCTQVRVVVCTWAQVVDCTRGRVGDCTRGQDLTAVIDPLFLCS